MSIRNNIQQISKEIRMKFWDLAPLLYECYEEKLFLDWGFGTFSKYVEEDTGFSSTTGRCAVSIWRWYLDLPSEARQWARTVPWANLKIIISVATPDNWEEWKSIVAVRAQKEIQEYVNEYKLAGPRDRARRNRLEKGRSRIKNALPEDANIAEKMACFRNCGATYEDAAEEFDVDTANVQSLIRHLSLFIPTDVYERIHRAAFNNGLSINEELAWVLADVYEDADRRQQLKLKIV